MNRLLALFLVCTPLSTVLARQATPAPPDSLRHYRLETIVISASRTPRDLRDVPEPVEIISNEDARALGVTRLGDLIEAHGTATIVHAFGSGVQMQGLSTEYVLILIDGLPVIGRTAGTLDLQRISVADVDRVEVVRGPSSSRYGSDALAGVINVITRDPTPGFRANARFHAQGNATTDASASVSWANDVASAAMTSSRYASGGYDLLPGVAGQTVPGFRNYSGSLKATLFPNGPHTLSVDAMASDASQRDEIGQSVPPGFQPLSNDADRREYALSAKHDGRWSQKIRVTELFSRSQFEDWSTLGSETAAYRENQTRAELQATYVPGASSVLTMGVGGIAESVETPRVQAGRQSSKAAFVFAEYQRVLADPIEVIASARYDHHEDYAARLSPKLAGVFRFSDALQARLSIGSGFKAPSFQQRYLDFTNPLGGYTVFGAVDVDESIARLNEQGLIVGYDPAALPKTDLKPEHSTSFNAGFDWYSDNRLSVRFNGFFNSVRDMIETLPVAGKTNGQQVFTYVNLNRIHTYGYEVVAELTRFGPLDLSARYQYLVAYDVEVARDVSAGRYFKRENGRDRTVRRDEYGGLFQRSRHSASLQVAFEPYEAGPRAVLHANIRGRYGLFDRNGNLILDDATEYVPAYSLWNVTLLQSIGSNATLRAGVKNVFDHTDPTRSPAIPGRLYFGGFSINL